MTSTRHLGLDLGGTLLKWAVVESTDGRWDRLATGVVPTRLDAGADGLVAQLQETAAAAIADWGPRPPSAWGSQGATTPPEAG